MTEPTERAGGVREAVARVIYEAMGYEYDGRTIGARGPYGAWEVALTTADALAALPPAAPAEGAVRPEDQAELFIQAAIDSAPEPLRRLGEWLAHKLDDDDWKTADRLITGAAVACASLAAELDQAAGVIKDRNAELDALTAAPAPAVVTEPVAEGEAVAWQVVIPGFGPAYFHTRAEVDYQLDQEGCAQSVVTLLYAHPPAAEAQMVCDSYADENQRLHDRATAAEARLETMASALKGVLAHMPDHPDTLWEVAAEALLPVNGEGSL